MLDKYFSYKILIGLALVMGVMPLTPRPHLVEKLQMLWEGSLTRPIDVFDLFWHSWPVLLLVLKLVRDRFRARS